MLHWQLSREEAAETAARYEDEAERCNVPIDEIVDRIRENPADTSGQYRN